MSVFRSVAHLLILIGLLTGCGGASPPQPTTNSGAGNVSPGAQAEAAINEADQRLTAEVTEFLDDWVAKRRPSAAVSGRASAVFGDRRFVPTAALSEAEYKAQAADASASAPIGPQTFESTLQMQLAAALGDDAPLQGAAPAGAPGLESLLKPLSPEIARETDPELWSHLGPHNPRSVAIAGVPSLAYQVRDWSDIQWTASGNTGLRFALAGLINERKVNVQAVVARLKGIEGATREPLLVLLWSDEGTGGMEWRYFAMERIADQ